MTDQLGEQPWRSTQAKGENCEAIKLACPLETKEGHTVRVHLHVVVSTRQITSPPPADPLEKCASLTLQRFHAECVLGKVLVHMSTIPDQASFACRVASNAKGKNAMQRLVLARLHCAKRNAFCHLFTHKGGMILCRWMIVQPAAGWRSRFWIPRQSISRVYNRQGIGVKIANLMHGCQPISTMRS